MYENQNQWMVSFYVIMEWLGRESPSIYIPPELSVPLVKYRQKLNIPVWLELQTAHDILCALPIKILQVKNPKPA